MSLGTISLIVGIAAAGLTFAMSRLSNRVENVILSFLQNFTGLLFIFSGWVKAVDPLGTAYKMEQYFGEFESTFADTAVSFLSPVFPVLAEGAVGFAVAMIVLEIVLGLMLVLGALPRLTAWAFLLLVAFFTLLTGFTYLTGYVPAGVNFFSFGEWGAFRETNMKVTDCGCFGDFIKLKPQVSFAKDIVLLGPALLFVFANRQMHQVFSKTIRLTAVGLSIPLLLWYCFSNYVWDLPHLDFRPFKEGVNIAEQKAAEEEAMANVEVLGFKATHKRTGKEVELSYDEFMANFKDFPSEEWEIEQLKSEPAIEPSKISDFEFSDLNGYEATEAILGDTGYLFLLVAHELKGTERVVPETVRDTVFTVDTLRHEGREEYVKKVANVAERQRSTIQYEWQESYLQRWQKALLPLLQEARSAGYGAAAVFRIAAPEQLQAFREAAGFDFPIYQADDILLKTIIRSNPGLVVLREGKILGKWHYRQLPDGLDEIKAGFSD